MMSLTGQKLQYTPALAAMGKVVSSQICKNFQKLMDSC